MNSERPNPGLSLTPSAYGKIAVITCLAGCMGDFMITFVLGLVYPNYNLFTEEESYLGTANSPVATYMNTWEIIFTLLFVSCAYCLFKTGFFSKSKWHICAPLLLAVYGLGEGIGSGLFPFEHVHNQLTTTGVFHTVFSGIGDFAIVALSFVVVKLFPKKDFTGLNRYFLFFQFLGILFIILWQLSGTNAVKFTGLWQRLFLLDYYIMLLTLTVHVYRSTRENPVMAS